MKLLTHNMLACHIKGVQNGYPLKIEAEKVETREIDFEPDFLRHIFPRIQWAALREGAAAMGEWRRRRRQRGERQGPGVFCRGSRALGAAPRLPNAAPQTLGLSCPAVRPAGVADLPEAASEEMLEDDDFLKKFHHALLEVHLEQGALVCPETGDSPPLAAPRQSAAAECRGGRLCPSAAGSVPGARLLTALPPLRLGPPQHRRRRAQVPRQRRHPQLATNRGRVLRRDVLVTASAGFGLGRPQALPFCPAAALLFPPPAPFPAALACLCRSSLPLSCPAPCLNYGPPPITNSTDDGCCGCKCLPNPPAPSQHSDNHHP